MTYPYGIGGTTTVGRVRFRDPVKLAEPLVEERTKSGRLVVGTYDPARMSDEADAQWFQRRFGVRLNREMRTLREKAGGSDGHRRCEKVWYFDDEGKDVYFRADCG